MNYRDMQKPLVQTALVLLAILVVIGFVAGSDAESFFGGVVSIFKGVIYTILFAFALVIGLVFSVILLIAIFLGAVSLYSSDKSKEMYADVRQRITDLYLTWTNRPRVQTDNATTAPTSSDLRSSQSQTVSSQQPDIQFVTTASLESVDEKFSAEIAGIKNNIESLNGSNGSLLASLGTLQQTVTSFPGAEIAERIDKLEAQQEKLVSELEGSLQKLEKMSSTTKFEEELKKLNKDMGTIKGEIDSLTKNIKDLQVSRSQPSKESSKEADRTTPKKEEPRIFAYLEKEADKKQLIKFVTEAVAKNMTYAEIDTFLSKSLSKKIYTIIKEHPSLTKEYIRDCRSS